MEVIKRNGAKVPFDADKIYQALLKSAGSVYVVGEDLKEQLASVTKRVVLDLTGVGSDVVTISMVQSMVEQRLLSAGYIQLAEHYIGYRLQRDLERYGYADRLAVHLRFERLQ